MKVLSRTDSEMVLKDGNVTSIVFGLIFLIAGVEIAIHFPSTHSWILWAGLGASILGVLAIFLSSSIVVDINKASGRFTYKLKRLIGGSSMDYAIADVLRIETRRTVRMRNGSNGLRRQVFVESFIVFKNGEELQLDHQKGLTVVSVGPVAMIGKGSEAVLATQVADFIGVPFQEIAPDMSNISIGGIPL